jgi:hypothetical protein
VKQGKLKIVYINREAIFDQSEVEWLKREQSTPVHRSIVVNEETEKQSQKEEILLQMMTYLLDEVKKLSSESRLTHLEDLERCCDRGWLLRSHELKELVKLKRLPRSPFAMRGFIFDRQGKWWSVRKP